MVSIPTNSKDIENIFKKYGKQLEGGKSQELAIAQYDENISSEFTQFKSDMMPQFSRYEKWCRNIGGMIKFKLAAKDEEKMQKELNNAHLDVAPGQVASLAIIAFLLVFFGGIMLSAAIYLINFGTTNAPPIILILFLSLFTAGFLFYYFFNMPQRLANEWRLKAGSQMVPCILYTVVYMKHTSNLERAIRFASQHLEPPLALDLKKVFWDVETGRFSTIKESLDNYLETWRATNPEFVESFNLIESSLYEPSEVRRIEILERALQVMLDGVYDRMLKYTHSIRSPLTNIYMLGIVLPTLGLALIPLASALMQGMIKWYHVFILFNILAPFMVFYMTNEILLKRPGGYGESGILELNPLYPKYKSKKPYIKAALICLPLFLIGIFPLLLQFTAFQSLLHINPDITFQDLNIGILGSLKAFDFVKGTGPMGLLALFASLILTLSIALFFTIAYMGKTKEIIKSRDSSKILESEFNNSLFQLGNRIGDGTPAELAFGRVAESVRGQVTEDFFKTVNANIQSLGMPLEKAIFDTRRGAIINYPSNLISTSMHILIEGVKKGLKVAAQSLMSISDYIRNINKINDRLRDLLAEVISDMKSNMTFLAPLLAGIVVGLASMITLILSKLESVLNFAETNNMDISSLQQIKQITNIFQAQNMISPYILQICVGLYIIEIIFILTKTLVAVDAGEDKLKVTYETARNLRAGGVLYFITALLASLILSIIAAIALSGMTNMG